MIENIAKSKNINEGHRSRLRDRFLRSGLDGFSDYEVIELLLTLGTPRRDCKSVAKEAIAKFGGLNKTLEASQQELQEIKGIGPSNVFGLKLSQAVALRISRETLSSKLKFNSTKIIAEYLNKLIGKEKVENLVVLYLDSVFQLIDIKIISVGILDSTLVHPREVFALAISLRSGHVIISHNHPSGILTPSRDDRATTEKLKKAGEIMGIELHDHIIVNGIGYFSFKDELLM